MLPENFRMWDEFDHHEDIIPFYDKSSGLQGYVAIHCSQAGKAVGGTRFFPYATADLALRDVLRLSRAMTYKCLVAHVPYGGAKAVIIGDPKAIKTRELLKAYARVIESLSGRFYTGEDVGMTEEDVQYLLSLNDFFIGRTGLAGDPSPYASRSVFEAIKTSLPLVFNTHSLVGLKVAIKGVGKVGSELARLLYHNGAEIYVADIDKNQIRLLKEELPLVHEVSTEKIASSDVDVFAPCALGGDLHTGSLPELKAKLVCGGANNQLASLSVAEELHALGKVYVPDVLANAGGLINVVDELEAGGYAPHRVTQRIMNLQDMLRGFFATSFLQNKPLAICLEEYVRTTLAAQSHGRKENLISALSVHA